MKTKFVKISVAALALLMLLVPVSASAHERWGHHGHRGGHIDGLFSFGAAVVEGTAAILTAPFIALGAMAEPGYYPQPAYYAQRPVYYAPPPVAYAPPPGYYYQQAPGYYPAPPGYYSYPPPPPRY
jgi:hypothetical protein